MQVHGGTGILALALPLLKTMLGLPLSLSDLEYVDPASYRRIVEVLATDNDGDLEKQEVHFSVMEKLGDEEFVVVDLIPDGRYVAVTNSNKHEYVDHVFKYALFERVSSQLYTFLKGFSEVIPKELLLPFGPEELDYVLCGSHEINVVGSKIRRKKHKKKSKHKQMNSSGSFSEVGEMLLESTMAAIEVAGLLS